jgi:hypothetical protein
MNRLTTKAKRGARVRQKVNNQSLSAKLDGWFCPRGPQKLQVLSCPSRAIRGAKSILILHVQS